MPNPLQGADVVGHTLRFAELGLTNRDLGNSLNVDLTAYKTAVPETVLVLVQIASGQVDVQVDVNATGTFASADASSGNVTATGYIFGQTVDTSAANPYVNVRLVTGASGARIAKLLVLPLAKLSAGEEWYNIRDGVMAVANTTVGDGSGAFTFTYTD